MLRVLWLLEHQRVWSLGLLVLLLIAFAGPWSFDLINVPSEYSCAAPFIRLKGDYCGVPLPGTWIFLALISQFALTIWDLATGTIVATELSRGLPILLVSCLLFLPFFGTSFTILRRGRPRKHLLHFAVWAIATLSIVWWYLLSPPEWPSSHLWGRTLYFGIALGMLALEVILAAGRRHNPAA
jgi:hypothetical protein